MYARCMASVTGRAGRKDCCSGKRRSWTAASLRRKRGLRRRLKPSAARARSGCTGRRGGLPLEFGSKVPLREKLRLRKPRSPKSTSPGPKAGRAEAETHNRHRAYDSDPLRDRLKKRGIDLIVPYRKNSKHRRYEDGRKLRRYKRRWIIERTNAWLGQFRRLLVRHEHLLPTYRPSSISLASGSHCAGVYETRSNKYCTNYVDPNCCQDNSCAFGQCFTCTEECIAAPQQAGQQCCSGADCAGSLFCEGVDQPHAWTVLIPATTPYALATPVAAPVAAAGVAGWRGLRLVFRSMLRRRVPAPQMGNIVRQVAVVLANFCNAGNVCQANGAAPLRARS